MRGALVLLLAACGNDSPQDNGHDAYVPRDTVTDGSQVMCSALAGTANMTINITPGTTYTRLDAGGTLQAGPVAVASAPVSLSLLFTSADPLTQNEAGCCQGHSTTCCSHDGVVVSSVGLTSGTEVGTHPVMVDRFDGTFTTTGTLTITTFVNPFDQAPGRIAGSLSTLSAQVTGTFDNAFCQALLTVTI